MLITSVFRIFLLLAQTFSSPSHLSSQFSASHIWMQSSSLGVPYYLFAKRSVNVHPASNPAYAWLYSYAFLALCQSFIVVKCNCHIQFARDSAWFSITSVCSSYPYSSSFLWLTFSAHQMMFMTLGDSVHVLKSAGALWSRFAPAIGILSAHKHEMSYSRLLMYCRKALYIILWNR